MTIRFGYLVTFSTLGNIVEPLLLQERFLQLLAGSAHRFEYIRDIEWELMSAVMALMPMDAPFSRLKSLFISRISSSFLLNPTPNLTHLSVDGVHNSDDRISFQSIPFLTHFQICGLKYPQTIFQAFPWAQITHFTSKPYVRYRERELSSILQQMKNLLSLNLMGETVIGRSIILTTLHTLSLERHETGRMR
ncbi:hypothetical protein BDQ17DRAFT_128315 [Cyathus striatus]|nr:hypothetical protein BDQ17DRAFT_128315 [Cyathus striatus]